MTGDRCSMAGWLRVLGFLAGCAVLGALAGVALAEAFWRRVNTHGGTGR